MQNNPPIKILDNVAIATTIGLAWLDALSTIATQLRFQNNFKHLPIAKDSATPNNDGTLSLVTYVGSERVELVVPPKMWEIEKTSQ